MQFYTGLLKRYWDVLWMDLQLSTENKLSQKSAYTEERERKICPGSGRKCALSLEDELFMTLIRLRLGRLEAELGFEFGISPSTVSRICNKFKMPLLSVSSRSDIEPVNS